MQPDIRKKCARRYDREFKQDAVALVRSGRTITEVARDLGVSHWSLARWVKEVEAGQALKEPGTIASESAEQREIRLLRQQNEYLQRQREILKKALGILSEQTPSNDLR